MAIIKFVLQRKAPTFWAFMTGKGAEVVKYSVAPKAPQEWKSQRPVQTWQDSLDSLNQLAEL